MMPRVNWLGVLFGVAIGATVIAAHGQEVATSDPALICGRVDGMSYSRQHRKLLLEDERQADFARWHVPWNEHRNYELDHIIPLCLGGADTPANRRPQRCDHWEGIRCVAGPAYEKDKDEARACRAACASHDLDAAAGPTETGADPTGAAGEIEMWQAIFARWKYE